MKKYLSLLIGGFIILVMFAAPGNSVKAESLTTSATILSNSLTKGSTDCGCGTPILGTEKNKIIAELLKSEEFKNKKKEAVSKGYLWRGADGISVSDLGELGLGIGVIVPFYDKDGVLWGYAFLDGKFAFSAPME